MAHMLFSYCLSRSAPGARPLGKSSAASTAAVGLQEEQKIRRVKAGERGRGAAQEGS